MTAITAISVVVARIIPSRVRAVRNLFARSEPAATRIASRKEAECCTFCLDADDEAKLPKITAPAGLNFRLVFGRPAAAVFLRMPAQTERANAANGNNPARQTTVWR